MSDLFVANEITVDFGAVRAVDGVSMSVAAGEILGLIGPNGSGKSTFLNAISGVVPASGEATVNGRQLALGRPRKIRHAGLMRTYQTPQNIMSLTCLENVLLTTTDQRRRGLAGSWLDRRGMVAAERERCAKAYAALDRVGLAEFAHAPTGLLTYGRQRLLELAGALAGDPVMLMLDEPAAGLNETETEFLAGILTGMNESGVAILLVEHKIDFIDELCQRIVVLELGSVIAEGSPTDVWRNARVIDAYLGQGAPSDG